MDSQIETLDEQTEAEIEIALDELRSVQFCDNTYTQAIEAHEEVEIIIRALAKRLTMLAPDKGQAAVVKDNQVFAPCG